MKTLVAYFSAEGRTAKLAASLAERDLSGLDPASDILLAEKA